MTVLSSQVDATAAPIARNLRVAVQQRVVPEYRVPLFDSLARSLGGKLDLLAGAPKKGEAIATASPRTASLHPLRNIYVGRGTDYLCWQHGLTRWLTESNPDVLICEANYRLISTRRALSFMHSRQRPVIGWGLGTLPWSTRQYARNIRAHLLGNFYGQFDALIAYSTKAADDYAHFGVSRERIFVAKNAVCSEAAEKLYDELSRSPDAVRQWKQALGIGDKPVVLFVGRLIQAKRTDKLVRAMGQLASDCQLLIVGDGPELPALKQLASTVAPNTVFAGHRTGRELGLCFAASDLFVLPGPGGLAMQEATIYGKAVIVCCGDGTEHDLVKDGRNGYILEDDSPVSVATCIRKAISNPESLLSMGRESRRIASEEVNLDRMVVSFRSAIAYALANSVKLSRLPEG